MRTFCYRVMVASGGWVARMSKMLLSPIIEVVPNPSSLAERAAEEFFRLAELAMANEGRFTVALAGGTTPQLMYTFLSKMNLSWDRIHFFWGDERCFPPDHQNSNYHMAYETLIKAIPSPSQNIHRIQGEFPVEQAAKQYKEDLYLFFKGTLPRFDLILLGLGSDGHTASLFPGTPAAREMSNWVAPVIHRDPPLPLVDRVTLTLPVLNSAAQVLFMVSGAEKAESLAQVLHGKSQPGLLPAQAVKPVNGKLLWLVDQAAAEMLCPLIQT